MNSEIKTNEPLIDYRFNILSYEQYLKDLETYKFTKISMTEVINADMMIASFGENRYFKTCTEILHTGNAAYVQLGLDKIIHVYINTYKSFMAVANDDISDEDFLNLMRGFYEQYELINSKKTELGGISRFIIAFGSGEELIDRAKSALYMHRDQQVNFIVATDEKERLTRETEKNVALFSLLNYALTNDKVVPYYQGIYDNNLNEITRYEALMRIYDQEGNICPPGMFLDAAKEFKLYLPLSKKMLDKAMKDFEGKQSTLSINISMFDIQSKDFRDWFLNRVKEHTNPSKISIEFVETEDYNNDTELFEFLDNARKIGCKVAVYDFGVGFATYTSVISLKPEIIKIDGDIIKNLANNNENLIILESICYMARLINSELVAEFVEDKDIQEIVLNHNIKYSQGYHFAKPDKICNLNIK